MQIHRVVRNRADWEEWQREHREYLTDTALREPFTYPAMPITYGLKFEADIPVFTQVVFITLTDLENFTKAFD